jgi:5'-nucleotidase
MNKKILYIDMDGVIADFDKEIKKYDPTLETSDKFPNWEEREKRVDDIVNSNPTFFVVLEPINGAKENIEKLMDIYDVYFLSTPMSNIPISYVAKKLWIDIHFGEKAKKRLILTHRKDLCFGDFLIDDRVKNGAGQFKGELIPFVYSDNAWNEIYEYLLKRSFE